MGDTQERDLYRLIIGQLDQDGHDEAARNLKDRIPSIASLPIPASSKLLEMFFPRVKEGRLDIPTQEGRGDAVQPESPVSSIGRGPLSQSSSKEADDERSSSSDSAQGNSDDEREQNEAREKQERYVTSHIICEVGAYVTSEITLEKAGNEILTRIVGAEKFSKPSMQTVFKCYVAASIKEPSPEVSAKYGHVLAYCLYQTSEKGYAGRMEILKGIADGCGVIVEKEKWESVPYVWEKVAEVFINTYILGQNIFVCSRLEQFKESYHIAAQDTRKPYSLYVLVLKRYAEKYFENDRANYMSAANIRFDTIEVEEAMEEEKLNQAMMDTKMEFADNLYKIMRQDG